jgi:BMFP domain-containing protein YqiC
VTEKTSGETGGKAIMPVLWPGRAGGVNLVAGGAKGHMMERSPARESAMQTRNKIFDDLSQLMTNAMGVAQGARDEAQNAMKSLMDRWLADRDLVTREEFEAVRAMAQKAREENAALGARIAALEKAAGGTGTAPRKAAARPAAKAASKGAGKAAP